MNLIVAKSGAPAGGLADLFDGTWYEIFASAPTACASGVSAQSYHFFAFSRFFAPLMIDIEPIS